MITPNEIYVLRRVLRRTKTDLFKIIAQDDDNDYSESGWVAVYDSARKMCGLARYSHCSCYGTWEDLENKGWNWEGTPAQLAKLARKQLDPDMPERKIDPKDYDYDHLISVYNQILVWYKNRKQ